MKNKNKQTLRKTAMAGLVSLVGLAPLGCGENTSPMPHSDAAGEYNGLRVISFPHGNTNEIRLVDDEAGHYLTAMLDKATGGISYIEMGAWHEVGDGAIDAGDRILNYLSSEELMKANDAIREQKK